MKKILTSDQARAIADASAPTVLVVGTGVPLLVAFAPLNGIATTLLAFVHATGMFLGMGWLW